MTILNEKSSQLVIIDVQEKLLNASFNKQLLEKKAVIMAKAASILGLPIVVTEQYPKGLGNTIESIKDSLGENAAYFEKTSFSALENPSVASAIDKAARKQIIIFGIETHICVSQTANGLIAKGYEVSVISDACGSRVETEHKAGLDRMKENGAHILTTEIAVFELLKSARHLHFKEIQNLIK